MYLQNRPCFEDHPITKQQPHCLSGVTINTYVRSLRVFFSWLYEEGIIEVHPFERVKIPKPPKKIVQTFSEDNVRAVLRMAGMATAGLLPY
jgi:site-specific recombinase XerD